MLVVERQRLILEHVLTGPGFDVTEVQLIRDLGVEVRPATP
jgi:hypothetical protein